MGAKPDLSVNDLRRPGARRRGRALLCWLAIWAGGSALAEEDSVYTWKDAGGRTHYGNRPPEGQDAKPVPLNAKPVAVQPTERIYTWTDDAGEIHYGARPPTDLPAKELREEDTSLSTIRSTQMRPGERQLLREKTRNP